MSKKAGRPKSEPTKIITTRIQISQEAALRKHISKFKQNAKKKATKKTKSTN